PSYFTSTSPARITFDFSGVKNQLPWTLPLKIKGGVNASSVTAVEASGRTRVVINLHELVGYETRIENGSLFIKLNSEEAVASSSVQDQASAVNAEPIVASVVEPAAATVVTVGKEMNKLSLLQIKQQIIADRKLQLRLLFDGGTPKVSEFSIDNPPRLVFDLEGVTSELKNNNIELGIGAVKGIDAVEVGGRTRIVISLVDSVNYEAKSVGRELLITFDSPNSGRESVSLSDEHEISAIDFRRGDDGQGRIIVKLSSQSVVTDTRLVGKKVIVDFMNTALPTGLAKRYDVLDFATPVKSIDANAAAGYTRLVVTMKDDFEHLAFQAEKQFTLEVKEPQTNKKIGGVDGEYIGDKLSLNFQDIEVRAVLQLIADFTGLNMVASDTVTGNLTLRLKNVPWDQALEIILRTKGLAMRQEGNVILVAPSEEVAAREKMELESQRQLEDLEAIRTELIQVNYAKATELVNLLSDGEGLLSARGKVSVDERTNTLLVSDISEKRENIRELIGRLDVPIRQVMIDSRIVIASSNFSRDLGARFGVTNFDRQGDNLFMTSGSSRAVGSTMVNSALDTSINGIEVPTGPSNYTDRLNVNMPVSAANAGRFALSILSGGSLLDLEISALQAEGRGEVVSSPRVVTSNGKEALIEQGTEIPYREASSSGAATISFKKAVLSLTVTPQITPDDRVLMDLRVSKDSVGEVFANVPSIDTKEVRSQVLVNNGDTVVLGGVYEQTKMEGVSKVPFLGDLPILGALFRNTSKQDDKVELLIFVTPKILKEGGRLH
ncbi:Type IV pilus biogenesis protein PilQ, partial [hydrothermal vent metagenome]